MSDNEMILDENLDGKDFSVDVQNLATTGQRFVNYLVDTITYYVLSFIFGGIAGVLVNAAGGNIESYLIPIQIVSFFGYLLYFIVMEGATGRTVGKFVSGTMVVYANGEKPSYWSAFTRTLSRIVPFEVFTAFSDSGRMWHDKWTDTYVVKAR